MAEESNEGKVAEKKKSPVLLIVIIILVLVIIGGGVAGYFLFMSGKDKSPAPAAQSAPAAQAQAQGQQQELSSEAGMSGSMKTLDSFIVNLTDAQGTRYLKVVMQLEMSNDLLGPEIDRKSPQIRDEIIMLLSSKSFDDISTIAGKRALKRSILNSINKYLTSGRVIRVYFSDFVVQ